MCTFALAPAAPDRAGRARVMDFGLARTTEPRAPDAPRTTPAEYGQVRFLLARALRAAKRQPERARALAEEAAAAFRSLGPLRREPDEIAAWLQKS